MYYITGNPEIPVDLVLNTNLLAFPIDLVKIILSLNYSRNFQLTKSVELLKEVKGCETEVSELLF